jgi:hypothetical protein
VSQDTPRGRRSRKQRKTSGIYQLEPLFGDAKKDTLTVNETSFFVDGRIGEYLIVSVPVTTTRASALALEEEFKKVAKRPVLVVTHNMSFLKATLLTGKEKAKLAEEIAKATTDKGVNPDGCEGHA